MRILFENKCRATPHAAQISRARHLNRHEIMIAGRSPRRYADDPSISRHAYTAIGHRPWRRLGCIGHALVVPRLMRTYARPLPSRRYTICDASCSPGTQLACVEHEHRKPGMAATLSPKISLRSSDAWQYINAQNQRDRPMSDTRKPHEAQDVRRRLLEKKSP